MKIEWNGGEMPVPEGTPIRVWYRSAHRESKVCNAGDVYSTDWSHGSPLGDERSGDDIVAYEVLGGLETPVEPPTQWEYALEPMPHGTVKEIRDYLNWYGDDCWELCLTDFGHLIFKRRKS